MVVYHSIFVISPNKLKVLLIISHCCCVFVQGYNEDIENIRSQLEDGDSSQDRDISGPAHNIVSSVS